MPPSSVLCLQVLFLRIVQSLGTSRACFCLYENGRCSKKMNVDEAACSIINGVSPIEADQMRQEHPVKMSTGLTLGVDPVFLFREYEQSAVWGDVYETRFSSWVFGFTQGGNLQDDFHFSHPSN